MTAVSERPAMRAAGEAPRAVPRILLASAVPPVPEGVGGVYLRDLCAWYPADRLAFATLPGIGTGPWPPWLAPAPRTTLSPAPERGFNRWGRRVQRSTRWAFDRYVERVHTPRIIDEIVDFGRAQGAELLWVPLSTPTMINVAARAAHRLGIPLLTTVWDAPDYFLPRYWGVEGRALRELLRRFDHAVASATRCAVASGQMGEAYESRYGTPCVPMIHGLPESDWIAPTGMRPAGEPFVLAYAGSLYARREWEALLSALSASDWRVGGRDVVVRVLASELEVRVSGPARIEYLGWQPTGDAVRIISECDACYVPYWFDEACRSGVELSFPNKISLYLAAGRPIFFHGPRRSTPTRFLERYPAGIACHSLDAREIFDSLTALACDGALHTRAADAIALALREELGAHVFRRRFAEFVGVDEGALVSR